MEKSQIRKHRLHSVLRLAEDLGQQFGEWKKVVKWDDEFWLSMVSPTFSVIKAQKNQVYLLY